MGNTGNFQHNREALKAIKRKQYGTAIAILEKLGGAGLESEYTLFLLSLALVYNNDFSRAVSLLRRIERINHKYIPYIQLKSFLGLKSALTKDAAISTYVEAIELAESDRLLKKILRDIENTPDFLVFQKNSKIRDFVVIPKPKSPGRKSRGALNIKGIGGFLLLVFIVGVVYLNRSFVAELFSPGGEGEKNMLIGSESGSPSKRESLGEIDSVVLGSTDYGLLNRVNRKKTREFYHSRTELLSDFRNAKQLIKKKRENQALIILNKINNSNINYVAKEKVEFLIKFIIDSDERKYMEYNLSDIKKSPHLYRGVALSVNGKTANVLEKRGGLTFSLLANYSENRFTELVNVFSNDKPKIENGERVGVKGIFIPMKNSFSSSYVLARSISLKDHK